MNVRKIVTLLLGLLVVASVAYLVAGGARGRTASNQETLQAGAASDGNAAPAAAHRVIAYYFHGSQRCKTCLTIEAYTAEAIRASFADALSDGTLEWKVVNIEEPENEHFVEDYQISTRTVVLVEMQDGKQIRWSPLGRVWELVGDKPAFMAYIQDETKGYLGS
jgi:hypothetical protein